MAVSKMFLYLPLTFRSMCIQNWIVSQPRRCLWFMHGKIS